MQYIAKTDQYIEEIDTNILAILEQYIAPKSISNILLSSVLVFGAIYWFHPPKADQTGPHGPERRGSNGGINDKINILILLLKSIFNILVSPLGRGGPGQRRTTKPPGLVRCPPVPPARLPRARLQLPEATRGPGSTRGLSHPRVPQLG